MTYKLINHQKQEELALLESFKKELTPYIFTERQIEVLKKKIRNDDLTQTERNYLSNSIKKKFLALNILFSMLDFAKLTREIYNNMAKDLTRDITLKSERSIEENPHLRGIIKKLIIAKRISIITGAGISVSSGLPTFRGEDGLWLQIDPLESLSENGFKRNPSKTLKFLKELKEKITNSEPNIVHRTLARMELLFESFSIITQNIDGYHKKAGNNRIFELHGNILNNRMKNGIQLPDIKLFGEGISTKEYQYSFNSVVNSEILILIGTSGYFDYIKDLINNCPGYIIEINPEETELSSLCDSNIRERAEIILPRIYSCLLKNRLMREFRKNFKNKEIRSIYLYGSLLNERRLPNDIDLLIIPSETEIKKGTITEIKDKIRKISGITTDVEILKLKDIKEKLNIYRKNAILEGLLLYGENIKGELDGTM